MLGRREGDEKIVVTSSNLVDRSNVRRPPCRLDGRGLLRRRVRLSLSRRLAVTRCVAREAFYACERVPFSSFFSSRVAHSSWIQCVRARFRPCRTRVLRPSSDLGDSLRRVVGEAAAAVFRVIYVGVDASGPTDVFGVSGFFFPPVLYTDIW